MEHLHLIRDETMRELVRRVAQNDPTLMALPEMNGGDDDDDDDDADVWLALGHALIGNTCLRKLTLRDLVLTEVAAHALAQGMAQSKITDITLSGDCRAYPSQESEQGHIIRDIFYRGIQASTTIQKLHLIQSSLMEDPGDAWRGALLGVSTITIRVANGHGYVQAFSDVLSRATLLKELYIVLRGMEADDVTILAHVLCQNTSVTILYFYGTVPSGFLQHLFAQRPSPNSSITTIDASHCSIDDDCIELLVDRWLPNCPIKHLVLNSNEIGPTGAQRLIQALAAHPTMLKLNLHFNEGIGYAGLCMIGNELGNLQYLTHLDLSGCCTWTDHTNAESKAAKAQTRACQQAGQALLDGIKRNLSITELHVSENSLPENMEDEIDFYAALNKAGRYLLSVNHDLASSVWCHILTKCQRQHNFGPSLVYFYLREQPTLIRQSRKRKLKYS